MAIPQQVHPVIKNNPPIGVIGPIQLPKEKGKMDCVDNKYNDPLNNIIPMVIAVDALSIHFVAVIVCSYFFALAMDMDKTIKANACINWYRTPVSKVCKRSTGNTFFKACAPKAPKTTAKPAKIIPLI